MEKEYGTDFFIVCLGTKIIFTLFWSTLVAIVLWGTQASTSFWSLAHALGVTSFVHSCLVSLLAYICPTLRLAESILTFIQVYMTIFSGLIINLTAFSAVELYFVPWMSLMRWGYEWILVEEFNNANTSCSQAYVKQQGFGDLSTCQLVLQCAGLVGVAGYLLMYALSPGATAESGAALKGITHRND